MSNFDETPLEEEKIPVRARGEGGEPVKKMKKMKKKKTFFLSACQVLYEMDKFQLSCHKSPRHYCRMCYPYWYIVPECVLCKIFYCAHCKLNSACINCRKFVCNNCYTAHQDKFEDDDSVQEPYCGESGSDERHD